MRPLIASIVLLAIPALGFAQGALTPPSGAPAPTMKTLDQLEPRTPLKAGAPGVNQNTNGGFTITASGSYYLTANLTIASGDAIVIAASYVTLDLSGFTLSSTTVSPADGNGVFIADYLSDITIRNGHIRGNTVYNYTDKTFTGTGFRDGIIGPSLRTNILAENITVSNIAGCGIYSITTINNCAASVCGGTGLNADQVRDSSAVSCGFTAVYAIATASNCLGESTSDTGLEATTASNCYGYSDDSTGLIATNASNCRAQSETSTGLQAGTASNCYGYSTSVTGLYAATATNCYGTSGSGTGLYAATATNCTAYTQSGPIAMNVMGTANTCRGVNVNGGTSIQAAIAIGCTSGGGTILATNKYLMP